MATLTSIIQLSTSGVAKDRVNFTCSKISYVKNPAIQTGTLDISTIATIATAPAGTSSSDGMYMYVRNLDPTAHLDLTFDSNNTLKVGPGEMSFFCVHDSRVVKGTASTGTIKVEYGTWTLDKY